ncbi:MAG: hypothetical protein IPO93_14635 [Actinobacteria bacterium]|nr:hypothetical protein [Actinomycetota bacterium]
MEREVLAEPESVWRATRQRVADDGWGGRILEHRTSDGLWAGALYSPKWTSTFYSMQTLAGLGLPCDDPRARATASLLLERGVRADGSVALWSTDSPDTCVAGMLLRTVASFGLSDDARTRAVVHHLLDQQLADGGWNCRRARGATHSSFHTTLSVLEGLDAWSANTGGERMDVPPAEAAGREFLLVHRLFRSHRDGAVVSDAMTRFSYPRYWYYDILRALEYLAASGAAPDARCVDAVDIVLGRRGRDGRWRLGPRHGGRTWLVMERGGEPSRRVTLGALRVLTWWDHSSALAEPGRMAT